MVFISFPQATTSEEDNLLKKYEKFERKKKSLEKAANPEPEVVATTNNRPLEAKDAKKVIENLKKTGQLPHIIATQTKKTEFKRKIPTITTPNAQSSTAKQAKLDEAKLDEAKREMVTYDETFW